MTEESLKETRTRAAIDALRSQRNHACDFTVDLIAENAALQAQLDEAKASLETREAEITALQAQLEGDKQ